MKLLTSDVEELLKINFLAKKIKTVASICFVNRREQLTLKSIKKD